MVWKWWQLSDSQHLAAELIGRFEKDRPPLKSISLNTDTSVITALSNDYSYDTVYQRQLEVLGDAKDLLVVISTSGNSKNIINVLKEAKKKKIFSIALLGRDGGEAKKISNLSIIVPSHSTARIQEMHILIGHIVCSCVESIFELNVNVFLIAEIGINHNGDLSLAKKLINSASRCWIWCCKISKKKYWKSLYKRIFRLAKRKSMGKNTKRSEKGLEFEKKEYDEINEYCKIKRYFGPPPRGIWIHKIF